MSRIDLTVNKYLNEGTEKEDYKKVLKVIHSVKTKEQAEGAYNMIKNWFNIHSRDKGLSGSFGMSSVLDVMKERTDLLRMLVQIAKRNGDTDFVRDMNKLS